NVGMAALIHLFSYPTIGRPMVLVSISRYGFLMETTPAPSLHDDMPGSAAWAETVEAHDADRKTAAISPAWDRVDILEIFENRNIVESFLWTIRWESSVVRVAIQHRTFRISSHVDTAHP